MRLLHSTQSRNAIAREQTQKQQKSTNQITQTPTIVSAVLKTVLTTARITCVVRKVNLYWAACPAFTGKPIVRPVTLCTYRKDFIGIVKRILFLFLCGVVSAWFFSVFFHSWTPIRLSDCLSKNDQAKKTTRNSYYIFQVVLYLISEQWLIFFGTNLVLTIHFY